MAMAPYVQHAGIISSQDHPYREQPWCLVLQIRSPIEAYLHREASERGVIRGTVLWRAVNWGKNFLNATCDDILLCQRMEAIMSESAKEESPIP